MILITVLGLAVKNFECNRVNATKLKISVSMWKIHSEETYLVPVG